MKKIFCIFFLVFFILPINVFASELTLDPDVLKNKNETSSSITDIYKIPVFSDKYKDYIESKTKEKEDEKKDLLNSLFEDNTKDNYSREKEKAELFKEKKVINNSNGESKKNKFIPLLVIVLFFIFSLTIVLITNQYYKNKKDKDDSNVYYNNFENK
ncbi:hypothetical protein [Clostridium baratii]|uniref:hypothetical protein n=1 Tax=Clostridium baratii TaxID=1561 RepID=UPI0029119700|nr:hypothetical protein [Clostridium baratii]MDU4910894.1 hypothetical protein [Clostridium baratii]